MHMTYLLYVNHFLTLLGTEQTWKVQHGYSFIRQTRARILKLKRSIYRENEVIVRICKGQHRQSRHKFSRGRELTHHFNEPQQNSIQYAFID